MSRFRLIRHLLASSGAGGIVVSYDNRFGTDTVTAAATGWFTFGLHPGSKCIWLNSSGGNDANNGLTAATAKATWAAASALWLGGGYTAGDQLMVAGTGGRTYTDTAAVDLTSISGVSVTYPAAILSYDPANPSDSTKYGKLTGPDMPVVSGSGTSWTVQRVGNTGSNFGAVQGIEFKADGNAEIINNSLHDGLCFQNCRFNQVMLGINTGTGGTAANVSKSSFWGAWSTDAATYASGLFAWADGLKVQDCAFAHCGWKIGASRDDTATAGGASPFGHGDYMTAHNFNNVVDRCVYVDSAADGANFRGNVAATCIVSIDEPYGAVIGGISGSYAEAPTGTLVTLDDFAIMGSDTINSSNPRSGSGFNNSNTQLGSYVRNGAMFDNPNYGGANNAYFGSHNDNSGMSVYITFDNIRGYNYANFLGAGGGSFPDNITWSNSILDVSASTYGSNNSIWSGGTFPAAKTRSQIATAMGFTGASWTVQKAALVNAMLWRPDLPWAQSLLTIALPAYGLSLTKSPSVSPPDMTGITPAVVY